MRSALWQALDILGEDAEPEHLSVLWWVICDLMWKRFPKTSDDVGWAAATGAERVRMIIAAAPDCSYIANGTEPEAVLKRLCLAHLAQPGSPADE